MTSQTYKIPNGLRELLANFTYQVLKHQPEDVNHFAYTYFAKKTGQGTHRGSDAGSGQRDSEEDEEESQTMQSPQAFVQTRRRGVAAESFDPESTAAQNYERVVHPKTAEQRQRLEAALKPTLIFRSLDDDQMQEVLDAMYEREVHPGDAIIRQGEDGDNFYVIESGTYNVYIQDKSTGEDRQVNVLQDKGSFGELALMYNCPRAATVIAQTTGVIWAMDRDTFRAIILLRAFQKRKYFESLLDSVPLLQQMSYYERMNVADALKSKTFKSGENIIGQGEEGRSMFFVEFGQARVLMKRHKSANDREVNLLKPGDYFGELALLTKQPRAASVVAVTDCRVAELDVDSFERLLGPCEEIMKRNIEVYETQLKETFGSLENLPAFRSVSGV